MSSQTTDERTSGYHFSMSTAKLAGVVKCLQGEMGIPDADEGMVIMILLDMVLTKDQREAWQHDLDRGSVVELADLANRLLNEVSAC